MSDGVGELVERVRAELRAQRDPVRAQSAAAYMKVALPFAGVPMPAVRALSKRALRELPLETEARYRALLQQLFLEAELQEERYAALAIAGDRRCAPFQRASLLPLYRRMVSTAAWWDLVDDLSCRVGEILDREPEPTGRGLRSWARSKDLWLRRASIVCQRKLRDRTRLELLFDCIEPSLSRPEFFLRKAIGWALRSLAWHDPEAARRYVREHRERLSPLCVREALKNLPLERRGRA